MSRHDEEQAIAHDIALCELGMALTRGLVRKRYEAQRKACFEQIRAWNREDGLDAMSNAELLRELEG